MNYETVGMERETIRKLLSKATINRPAVEIANDLGIPASNLYDFLSRGTLGRNKLALVEKWLIEHELIPEQIHTPMEQIARELELAAAVVRSSCYTDEQKNTVLNRISEILPKLRGI